MRHRPYKFRTFDGAPFRSSLPTSSWQPQARSAGFSDVSMTPRGLAIVALSDPTMPNYHRTVAISVGSMRDLNGTLWILNCIGTVTCQKFRNLIPRGSESCEQLIVRKRWIMAGRVGDRPMQPLDVAQEDRTDLLRAERNHDSYRVDFDAV